MSRCAPPIDDLLFGDNLILFGKANLQEAKCFKSCLERYYSLFGQLINYSKSGVFFSPNLPISRVNSIKRFLGFDSIK